MAFPLLRFASARAASSSGNCSVPFLLRPPPPPRSLRVAGAAAPSLIGARHRSSTGPSYETSLRDPVRQVFLSQSNDVFTNLALEDWLYRHHDFDHKVSALLLSF